MEKSGSMTFKEMLTAFAKGPVGLGVLLAWYYCTFYSCVLVWPEWTIRESEQYWAISLAVAALMGVLLYGLFRAGIASFARRQTGRVAAMAAFGMAFVSSLLIFAGYMLPSSPTYLVVVGAVLSGIALPMLLLIWIEVLRQLNEEMIEFSVPAAFLVSIALYLPIVAMKNVASIAVVALLPLVSWWLADAQMFRTGQPKDANRNGRQSAEFSQGLDGRPASLGQSEHPLVVSSQKPAAQVVPVCQDGQWSAAFRKPTRGLVKTMVLFFVMWFSFAFFRSCVSPTYFTDRFDHYLAPFACAALLAALLCVLTLVHARKMGLFSTYRWVIPFMCLGYAMVLIDSSAISRLAFTASFVGLVGIQMCFAIVVAKQARRCQASVASIALPLLFAIGLGVSLGSATGLRAMGTVMAGGALNVGPLMIVLLVAAVMAWGVDADALVEEPAPMVVKEAAAGNILHFVGPTASIIDSMAVAQAKVLAKRFGLSPREREILGYLLAGRSRPFIRDELTLSLNTVNTHVRNIYAKVGVHSQQELLTLVRELEGGRPTEPHEEPLRKLG